MILTGFILILIAAVLAIVLDRIGVDSPLGNITWVVKLAKVLGIICIILGILMIVAAIVSLPFLIGAALAAA